MGQPVTICIALIWAVSVFLWSGDYASAEDHIAAFIAHAERHSLAPYFAVGRGVRAELAIRKSDVAAGVAALREALDVLHQDRYELLTTEFTCVIAEGLGQMGQSDRAVRTIDEAIDQVERNGDTFMMPELLRIKGDLLASPSRANFSAAEECLSQSLALGATQSALSWQLRAATSLTKLWRSQGRNVEAHDVLQRIYRQFTEGFDTADLRTARLLLGELPRSALC